MVQQGRGGTLAIVWTTLVAPLAECAALEWRRRLRARCDGIRWSIQHGVHYACSNRGT
jgi:hypothetical protein